MRKAACAVIAGMTGWCFSVQAADGTWNQAGSGNTYFWADSTNWVDGAVADGTNAFAHFDALDAVSSQFLDLGGAGWTVGHMKFTDLTPGSGFWGFKNGTLNLAATSGLPTIEVSDAVRDLGIEATVTLTGDLQKTGAGQLYLKNFPTGSVDVVEGEVVYYSNANPTKFTTQSITGAGDVRLMGQATGFYSFYPGTYTGTLSYTGRTIVQLTPSANWWQGTLWLEIDDVLPHASQLEIQSGKVYLRNQHVLGTTVAGLKGNVGTYITTDRAQIQKLTVDVASGESCSYYGVIGADGTGTGNTNILFTKTGNGTQILAGTNTYARGTAVSAGTLVGNLDSAFGSGDITVADGAALVLTNGVLNNYIDDQAALTLNASSALTLGFSGIDIVGGLSLDGGNTMLTAGMYSASALSERGDGTYEGNGIIQVGVGNAYDAWAISYGLAGGKTGDDDNDGLLNICEYGLGGDPTNAADRGISSVFKVMTIDGTNRAEYVYPQLHDVNCGVTYALEITDDLLEPVWTNAGYEVTGTNVTGDRFDFVTNRTTAVGSQKFLRLIME
jgi:autotransporter-associated beta strand protein